MVFWIVALILQAAVTFGALWLGWNLLGRKAERTDPVVAFWFGWYFQSLLVLACGWLGGLRTTPLVLLVMLPLALAVVDRREFLPWLRHTGRVYGTLLGGPFWAWLLNLAGFGWLVLQFSVPTFFYDTLHYHFGLPMLWLAEGRIGSVGPDVFAYLMMPTRMHFLWSLGLEGEEMASLVLLTLVVAAAFLLARVAGEGLRMPRPWPVLAMFALFTTPSIWDELIFRIVDITALVAGTVLLWWWHRARRASLWPLSDWARLGYILGTVLAAKPAVTLGYTLGGLGLITARRHRERSLIRGLVLCAVITGLALAPWLVHAWAAGGHPLVAKDPYLGNFEIYSSRWHGIYQDQFPGFGVGLRPLFHDLWDRVTHFYDPRRWRAAEFMGLPLLLGLPVALWVRGQTALSGWWYAGFLGYYLTYRMPRFTMILIPLGLILVLQLLRRVLGPRRLAAVLVIAALLHGVHYMQHPVTGTALRSGLGRLGLGPRFSVYPSSVPACVEANARLNPRRHRILFVGETRYYPCRIPFLFWNPYFRHPLERIPHGMPPEVWWTRYVRENGFTHILYTPFETRRIFEWPPSLFRRLEAWMLNHGRVIVQTRDSRKTTYLIELRFPDPVASAFEDPK